MARRSTPLPDDPTALRASLAKGADPNAVDDYGTPYLSVFAGEGRLDLVDVLLDHGAEPCPPDGATLVVALMRGHFAVAERLVARGASVDHGAGGRSALTHAMCYGEPPLEVVRWLVAHGAKLGGDSAGTFPLFEAAREGWTETVRLLLEAGANPNEGPIIDFGFGAPTQDSPLGVAMHYRRREVVALLKQAGAKKELPAPSIARQVDDPTLALGAALWEDDRAFVAELLQCGADPNGRTPSKEPFLAAAVRLQKPDYVELLLGAGADARVATEGKKGPPVLHDALQTAAWAQKPAEAETAARVVELLLAAGADPNAKHKSDSPLSLALGASKPAVRARLVRALLARGLDVNQKVGASRLVFELAQASDDAELFREVLERGATLDGKVHGATLAETVRDSGGKARKAIAALLAARAAG